jgi:hypothetical protein
MLSIPAARWWLEAFNIIADFNNGDDLPTGR